MKPGLLLDILLGGLLFLAEGFFICDHPCYCSAIWYPLVFWMFSICVDWWILGKSTFRVVKDFGELDHQCTPKIPGNSHRDVSSALTFSNMAGRKCCGCPTKRAASNGNTCHGRTRDACWRPSRGEPQCSCSFSIRRNVGTIWTSTKFPMPLCTSHMLLHMLRLGYRHFNHQWLQWLHGLRLRRSRCYDFVGHYRRTFAWHSLCDVWVHCILALHGPTSPQANVLSVCSNRHVC